jgi:hypothetical protein
LELGIDLGSLLEIGCLLSAGESKVSAAKVRPAKVRTAKVRTAKARAAKVNFGKVTRARIKIHDKNPTQSYQHLQKVINAFKKKQ